MTTNRTQEEMARMREEAARLGRCAVDELRAAAHGARSFSAERIELAARFAAQAWRFAERAAS